VVLAAPFTFTWTALAVAFALHWFTGSLGICLGYHRLLTHDGMKTYPWVRYLFATIGSLAGEGSPLDWVADHRKHHKHSDAEGDPHSPWRYGETVPALMKGLWWAHIGWMFDKEQTPQHTYAPDLIRDPAIRRISRQFVLWTVVSLALPPLIGGLATWSWQGALTAFFSIGAWPITSVRTRSRPSSRNSSGLLVRNLRIERRKLSG
jgi:stearoyl-CoA desaturase (delta-9 desaturase)